MPADIPGEAGRATLMQGRGDEIDLRQLTTFEEL
jgi:hypothetical protein